MTKTIFTQHIRVQNQEIHKLRAIKNIDELDVKEGQEYTVEITPYSNAKTVRQLGYYWGVIIPVVVEWQGLSKAVIDKSIEPKDTADQFLKDNCCSPIFVEVMGKPFEVKPSIAKMKVKQMATYLDDCVNFLGINGQHVPPPEWRE